MRRTWMVLLLVIMVGCAGCGSKKLPSSQVVCVTTHALQLLVSDLAGPAVEVRVLSDSSGKPVQNAASLAKGCAVLFGMGFAEDAWGTTIAAGQGQTVMLAAALPKKSAQESWLSFRDCTAVAQLIRDTLVGIYPDDKSDLDTRYAAFLDQCSQADGRLKQHFWKTTQRTFVAADTTWSDAARDYGLTIIIKPAVATLDLSSANAASTVVAWGTHTVVLDSRGSEASVSRGASDLQICRLDTLGTTTQAGFVPWLERQLTTLSSGLGS